MVDRDTHQVAHQEADHPVVGHEDEIAAVLLAFLIQKGHDPVLCLLPGFAIWKA